LEKQLLELKALYSKSEKRVAHYKMLPNKSVKEGRSNGRTQFLIKNKNESGYKYVKKSEYRELKKYIQKEYETNVNKTIKKLEAKLEKFLDEFDYSAIHDEYNKLPAGKREMIRPIIKTDELYINDWLEEHPSNQNQFPIGEEYKTNRGEHVRSKSEKIIADALDKYGVPYQYEPLVELGYNTIYPDFVVLNVKKRKTMYWEHFGLLSDMDYAFKNFNKIQKYEKCNYDIGRDVIITHESMEMPLDSKIVVRKIKEYLL
jgi:hypothetical protein